jgi:hypothetical protein
MHVCEGTLIKKSEVHKFKSLGCLVFCYGKVDTNYFAEKT